MKTFQDFLHIMDFNGNQTVQGPNESLSAASKGFKLVNYPFNIELIRYFLS